MDKANGQLPQLLVHVDAGAQHPTIVYTAPPDVFVRFLRALRLWNPHYEVEIETLDDDEHSPPWPIWCLRAWENNR
ncbi:hypothetical protein [Nocardia transvalensis]|uniref:hypothetical protein n=1 Tax=Nocardia transvalensis TaxID=37333 RepID=UPI0018933655|nr:hypothetical protein [Nocardia transvalensis]MBF6330997.1 hypothetical protein [Nocardia transvalensis]